MTLGYYDRIKNQSSTSKYIQVNKTNVDGTFKADPSVLKGTPSDKIITPQLKKDVNKIFSLKGNPLAALLGFAASLIPSSLSFNISEPKPTDDKAEYGKIQVKENKAGFIIISDETPNNVRYINLHPTGTYTALLNNGDYHTKITNDRQDITDGNWNIKTDKDKIEIISGENRLEIRKDSFDTIKGNSNCTVEESLNTLVKGDVADDFKKNYSGKIASDYAETVGGNKAEKTTGNLKETIGGNHQEMVGGSFRLIVNGGISIIAVGGAGVSTNIMCSGPVNMTSTSTVKIKAASIKLNCD